MQNLNLLIGLFFGSERNLKSALKNHKFKTVVKILIVAIFLAVAVVLIWIISAYITAWVQNKYFPSNVIPMYRSTQTIYENHPDGQQNFIDIDGRAQLVPLLSETLEAAINFGKMKGEEGKMYRHRVVVMALDPSIRYVKSSEGISSKYAYDPKDLYTFYLPDGKDIRNNEMREHVIPLGEKRYKVTLLSIDNRENKFSYSFRIEEVLEL